MFHGGGYIPMKDMKKIIASITPAELEVLKVLWVESPLVADEIIKRLETEGSSHPRTVKTLLNRLKKKLAIRYEEKDRRYHYFPTIDQKAFYRHETESFLGTFFNGRLSPMISFFSEQENLTEEDIRELTRLVEKMKSDDNA
jgi:predicted transcriptional regulator